MLKLTATAKAAPALSNLRIISAPRGSMLGDAGAWRAAKRISARAAAHAGDICRFGRVRCEEVGKAGCPLARTADRLRSGTPGSQAREIGRASCRESGEHGAA